MSQNIDSLENKWTGKRYLRLFGDLLEKLEWDVRFLHPNSRIHYKIKKVTPEAVQINVSQSKINKTGTKKQQDLRTLFIDTEVKYLTEDDLIKSTEKIFTKYFPKKKLDIQPYPFIVSVIEMNPKTIQAEIKRLDIRSKDISRETGIEYTQLTALITGKRPLSQPMKALFYYYFLVKSKNIK